MEVDRYETIKKIMRESPQFHLYRPVDSWEEKRYDERKKEYLEKNFEMSEEMNNEDRFEWNDFKDICKELIEWIIN